MKDGHKFTVRQRAAECWRLITDLGGDADGTRDPFIEFGVLETSKFGRIAKRFARYAR